MSNNKTLIGSRQTGHYQHMQHAEVSIRLYPSPWLHLDKHQQDIGSHQTGHYQHMQHAEVGCHF
jgi:hypothetical protein